MGLVEEHEEHLENPTVGKIEIQRRFVILIDWNNLETGLRSGGIGFQNFNWLLGPILEHGIVIFTFVFVPQLANTRLPVVQMANLYNFKIVQCPREFTSRGVSKDKDTVDATMIDLGISLIEHSDCTDIVIVSGDGDFSRFAARAMCSQKRVHVFSTREALSGDFRKLESDRILVNIIE